MAQSHKPLLNLSTLTERYVVRIDGKAYELRAMPRFSVTQYLDFPKLTARMGQLWAQKTRTEVEDEELAAVLDALCRIVLDAPDAVREQLTDVQRMQVCEVFINLQRAMPASRWSLNRGRPAMSSKSPAKKTGASSPRASRGSMAATR